MENAGTILVIDDEKDLCSLIQRILTKENYEVACAYNLEDADRKLPLLQPSIVLLDNNLPDGSGLDYFHSHRNLFKETTVIMITADVGPRTRLRALQEGIKHFLQKPFSIGRVKELIKDLV